MKAKKRRSKEARLIRKAVQSGDIQKDPIEDYYLDPYGRPIVQMLNEAEVETLGYKDRDLAADALNALGVAAREGIGMIPVVGETLDAAEVAHAAKHGTDYYGNEISPGLLGGLTAAGYLIPNIIERPLKAGFKALKKGYGKIKPTRLLDEIPDERAIVLKESEVIPPEEKILRHGREHYGSPADESVVEDTRKNLLEFVNSEEYRDRVLNALSLQEHQPSVWRDPSTYIQDETDRIISTTNKRIEKTDPFILDADKFHSDYINPSSNGGWSRDWTGLAYRSGYDAPIGSGANPKIVLDRSARRNVAAHEFAHTSMDKWRIDRAAAAVDTPKFKEGAEKSLEGKFAGNQFAKDYFSDPDEIRARAFEVIDAARKIGVSTDEMVDVVSEAIKKAPKIEGRNLNDLTSDEVASYFRLLNLRESIPGGLENLLLYFDANEVKNYLKKVYSLIPVAGAGAVAATRIGSEDEEPTSYAKGGIIKAVKKSAKSKKTKPKKRDYKDEYKKFQSSDKMKKYRAKLNKYNRDNGTYGNGDCLDASHRGGRIAGYEAESKNRGRREKSRIRKK